MKKVTVVIPVYNSEKYIARCIDSVINQTYQDFEIQIINDGSKDKSQEIIDSYTKKYPDKIISIEQENKGVAKSRNEAIKRSKSKYIMFLDNDDYLDRDYIEKYVNEIEKEELDVVIGGYKRPDENGNIVKTLKLQDKEWCKFMIMTPWAKIFKRQYLIDNDINFLVNNIGEDNYFNFKAMLLTDKIKILDYIGYNWFFNNSSVSNTRQKNIKQIDIYKFLNSSYNMLESEKLLDKHYKIIETVFTQYIIWIISYSTKGLTYKELGEEYDKIFNWLEERFPKYKRNDMISYTKPLGETFRSRFLMETFMIIHKIHLGKLLTFIYSKL